MLLFLGLFLSLIVPSESLLLSALVICLPLSSVSCFRVWFLAVVSVSNTQDKTPPVPGSTIIVHIFVAYSTIALPEISVSLRSSL